MDGDPPIVFLQGIVQEIEQVFCDLYILLARVLLEPLIAADPPRGIFQIAPAIESVA